MKSEMVWSHQFKSRCVQRYPASILSLSTCVKKLRTNEDKLPTSEDNHDIGDAHDMW